jgi:hypothetical protein
MSRQGLGRWQLIDVRFVQLGVAVFIGCAIGVAMNVGNNGPAMQWEKSSVGTSQPKRRQTPSKHFEASSPPSPSREVVNGWRVDVAPLSESTRRRIYFELCLAQDSGVGDTEAYKVIARRFSVGESIVYQIAGEGATKQWPLPISPH